MGGGTRADEHLRSQPSNLAVRTGPRDQTEAACRLALPAGISNQGGNLATVAATLRTLARDPRTQEFLLRCFNFWMGACCTASGCQPD
jgi:hypothetical protein